MPIYESNADRTNEHNVAKILEEKFGYQISVTDTTDDIDFIAHDGDDIYWVAELKCRNVSSTTYDTIFLEKRKRDTLERYAEENNIICLFIVKFNKSNEILIFELGKDVDIGRTKNNLGRTDRNDSNDLDTMYLVPINRMTKIQ